MNSLQNGGKSQVKKKLGFDSLQKKIPTKETHPYSKLVHVDNGGGRGRCGWAVNERWERELVLVYGRYHFCQGSKESEEVEGIKHYACCVDGEL